MASPTDVPSPTLTLLAELPSPTSISPADIPPPTFSTLEVDHRASVPYAPDDGLIAVVAEDDPLPEVVQFHSEKYYKSENDLTTSRGDEESRHHVKFSKRRLGISIIGVCLVVLGAVLGGVFGADSRHHDSKTPSVEPSGRPSGGNATTSSNPSPTGVRNVNILPNSNISATAYVWRMEPDNERTYSRLVVFQDINGALVACTWNTTQHKWDVLNLTDATKNSSLMNPAYGTPLASIALYSEPTQNLQANVWYLQPEGNVTNVNWHLNVEYPQVSTEYEAAPHHVKPGTALAVSRSFIANYPENYYEPVYLVQQYSDNKVTIIKLGETKTNVTVTFLDLEMQSSSHLGFWPPIQPVVKPINYLMLGYETNGRWVRRAYYTEIRKCEIPITSIERLNNMKFANRESFKVSEDSILIEDYKESPEDIKHLITMPFERNGATGNLYLILFLNGTFLGRADRHASMYPMTISGGPTTKFTAIATTDDARLFGISGDEVLEYVYNIYGDTSGNSSNFTYVGKVYP